MDKKIEKLNNNLNRKRTEFIEIRGVPNSDGRIRQSFNEIMKFDEDLDYMVSLISFEATSLFPNIRNTNNKFYYIENNTPKSITFTDGAYDVVDINSIIQKKIPNESIKITLDISSGRSTIELKPNFKVDFTKNDTFRDLLGFESIVIDTTTRSSHICSLITSAKIYIHLNIAKGNIFEGCRSNIIFSFANSVGFGQSIDIRPKFKLEHELETKYFNELSVWFTDENKKPIDFMSSQVTLCLMIQQV